MGLIGFIAVVVILAVAAVVLAQRMKQSSADGGDGLAFDRQVALFTPAERSFLGVLEQALDDRYRVFGKVRLGDLVRPAKGLSNSKRATAHNKLHQKHVDFVICSASDLAVVGVVELDDRSHERSDRAGRDRFVDRALAAAKIPVIHFPVMKGYALPEVRARLNEGLAIGTTSPDAPLIQSAPAPVKPATVPMEAIAPVAQEPVVVAPVMPVQKAEEEAEPVCPKCSASMVKRQAKKGPRAGEWFWACSAFPKCRQIVALGGN